MPIDVLLLDILVDPQDHEPLWYFEERALLFNPRTSVAYDIVESIPVLLPSEARALSADEAAALQSTLDSAQQTGAGRR